MNTEAPHWSKESVVNYYDNMTDIIEDQPEDTLVAHVGLVGDDGLSFPDPSPIHNARKILIEGLDLKPGMRVLDAGCGLGGNTFALAEEFGTNMVGITIAGSPIPRLQEKAKNRNLEHLCEFHEGDFNNLPFPDNYFDAAIQHESFCYVNEREAYFRGMLRVLKPGCRWHMLDYATTAADLPDEQYQPVFRMEKKWCLAPLVPAWEMLRCLKNAGFVDCVAVDQTAKLVPYARDIGNAMRDRFFVYHFSGNYTKEFLDTVDGLVALDEALTAGGMDYVLLSGRRPYED